MLLQWFRDARASLIDEYVLADPSVRVPWYGSAMSPATGLTARIMETWAHGQDVVDAVGAERPPTQALRQVAHLGVHAFANSYRTRGRDAPDAPVYVRLAGPGGATWEWGEPEAADRVEGTAVDFCLVVTQRRHLDDVGSRRHRARRVRVDVHRAGLRGARGVRSRVRAVRPRRVLDPRAGLGVERGQLGVEVGDVDLDVWQHPVEPVREPPVLVAQQLHRRRHENQPDDRGVDEHRDGEAEAEHLERVLVAEHEAAEDARP